MNKQTNKQTTNKQTNKIAVIQVSLFIKSESVALF